MQSMIASCRNSRPAWPRLDALLLAVLLIARLRIDTLAEAVGVPLHMNDVARQPLLGHLLSDQAMKLLAQQGLVDPIGMLLIVTALACLGLYLVVNEIRWRERVGYRVKLLLIWAILLLTVFAPSIKMMLLRQGSGPASYSHDGGVIQTEATVNFLLSGRNPYIEDYTRTPMAEWGIGEFRTALYHYPYLPWTFVFSAPFKLLADRTLGWYDQRMVYLLLFALTLALLPGLARQPQTRLLLVMLIGLNPIMGSDLIYGQNDSFVLAWIVLSLWLWVKASERRGRWADTPDKGDSTPGRGGGRGWYLASAAAFGLACASKPTAWFLAPFYLVLLAGSDELLERGKGGWERARGWLGGMLCRAWPALAAGALIIGPWFVWNPAAMYDDVWRWANGTSSRAYQIWGWGASNLLLAFGWVTSRFAYWPFWIPELLLGLPLMAWLLWRQLRENGLGAALWGYGLFILVFFFVSRFLNENYLGYLVAILVLGALADAGPCAAGDRPVPLPTEPG
jgi:hypothetical protein